MQRPRHDLEALWGAKNNSVSSTFMMDVVRAASKRGRICGWAEKKRMRYAIYTRRDKKQKDSENRGFIYQKITH
jgi:hypothetical protein